MYPVASEEGEGMGSTTNNSKAITIVCWVAQILAAVILAQTLFFKFSGAEESKFIFSSLHAEPVGRIGSGVIELVAVILLFISSLAWLGALIGLASMSGAIVSHAAILGIEVMGDGGQLFYLAVVTWICCAVVLLIRRAEIPIIGPKLKPNA